MTDPNPTDGPVESDHGPEETDMSVTAELEAPAVDDAARLDARAEELRAREAVEDARDDVTRIDLRAFLAGRARDPQQRAQIERAFHVAETRPEEVDADLARIDAEVAAEADRKRRAARWDAYRATIRPECADATYAGLKSWQNPDGRISKWWGSGHKTLLVAGPSEHGKTWAAHAITNEVAAADRDAPVGTRPLTVRCVRVVDVFQIAAPLKPHERNDEQASRARERALRDLRSCDLLLLDDLGRENLGQGEWTLSVLFDLFDARAANPNLRTVITLNAAAANVIGKNLAEKYGTPVFTRIKQDAVAAWVEGEPLRAYATWDPFA